MKRTRSSPPCVPASLPALTSTTLDGSKAGGLPAFCAIRPQKQAVWTNRRCQDRLRGGRHGLPWPVASSRTAFRTARRVALVALCVLTLLMVASASRAEPPPGATGWLYDTTTVADIDLGLPQSSIDGLAAEPSEYQPGSIVLHAAGRTYGPLQVGISLKGRNSFRPLGQKAAFKVKVDQYVEGQTIAGVEKLTLNNMVQDPTEV